MKFLSSNTWRDTSHVLDEFNLATRVTRYDDIVVHNRLSTLSDITTLVFELITIWFTADLWIMIPSFI